MDKRSLAKSAFLESLPIFSGYLAVGFTFGAIFSSRLSSTGISPTAVSLTSFAGGAQLALVPLLESNASYISVLLTLMLINIRHLAYGSAISDFGTNWKNIILSFFITDETYSVIIQNPNFLKEFWATLLFCFICFSYWLIGTWLGVQLTSLVTKNVLQLFDAALPLLFISLASNLVMKSKDYFSIIWAIPILFLGSYFGLGVGILIGCPLVMLIRQKLEGQ